MTPRDPISSAVLVSLFFSFLAAPSSALYGIIFGWSGTYTAAHHQTPDRLNLSVSEGGGRSPHCFSRGQKEKKRVGGGAETGLVLMTDNPVTNSWSSSKGCFPGCGFVMWMEREARGALRQRGKVFSSACVCHRLALCFDSDLHTLDWGFCGPTLGRCEAVLSFLVFVGSSLAAATSPPWVGDNVILWCIVEPLKPTPSHSIQDHY